MYKLAADDFGVLRFSASPLQAAATFLEKRPTKTILAALGRLRDVELVKAFTHQGAEYIFQPDWQTWQKITHPRQTKQPAPPVELCDAHTAWLLTLHPKGGRLKSWQAPDTLPKKPAKPGEVREDTGSSPEVLPDNTGSPPGEVRESSRPVGNGEWVMGDGCDRGRGGGSPPRLRVSGSAAVADPPKAEPAFVERRAASRTTDLEALRAGDFVERYAELHVKFRHGAPYVGKMHFDFQEALQLVKVYDDARLDKLAEVWFRTDHDFAENGTRTLAKFRSMASWCDERLRKAGL